MGLPQAAVYEVSSQAPSGILSSLVRQARTVHAAGRVLRTRPCGSLPQHSFPAAARPSPNVGGERRRGKNALHPAQPAERSAVIPSSLGRLACSWSGHGARTTVYPCGIGHDSKHHIPYAPKGVRHAWIRAHPSNERCLGRITRRHSGGSLRPPLPIHRPQRFCWLVSCLV
jgi:hypothetical protein